MIPPLAIATTSFEITLRTAAFREWAPVWIEGTGLAGHADGAAALDKDCIKVA